MATCQTHYLLMRLCARQNGHTYSKARYELRHWTLKEATTLATSRRETCGTSLPDTLTRSKALVPVAASSS